jgi:hypothetical protein
VTPFIIDDPVLSGKSVREMGSHQDDHVILGPHPTHQDPLPGPGKTGELYEKMSLIAHIPVHPKNLVHSRDLEHVGDCLFQIQGIDQKAVDPVRLVLLPA